MDGNDITRGKTLSQNRINITDIQKLHIHCSPNSLSIVNGNCSDVIKSFTPNRGPGRLLEISPSPPTYLPVIKNNLASRMRMEITDQSENEIDLNGEQVTYTLNLCPKM